MFGFMFLVSLFWLFVLYHLLNKKPETRNQKQIKKILF